MPLIVLIDETSASASEIFAGAIQDNDRGTVIGRRSFGKGLVQAPIEFRDGSMLRLTTARYYTPSGRCVQKPYVPGHDEDYEADLILRAEHGEYYSADSIRQNGEKFKTKLGRTVYGGGGIMPDVFIPRDTLGFTSYFKEAYLSGLLYQYAYEYVDQYRTALNKAHTADDVTAFINKHSLIEGFANFATKAGLKRRNLQIQQSRNLLTRYITTSIISDLLDESESAAYVNKFDDAVIRAIDIFTQGKAFPTAGAENGSSKTASLFPHAQTSVAPGAFALAQRAMQRNANLFIHHLATVNDHRPSLKQKISPLVLCTPSTKKRSTSAKA